MVLKVFTRISTWFYMLQMKKPYRLAATERRPAERQISEVDPSIYLVYLSIYLSIYLSSITSIYLAFYTRGEVADGRIEGGVTPGWKMY